MQLFYSPRLMADDSCFGTQFLLDPDEAAHALKVLRVEEGNLVHVTNGKGLLVKCAVIKTSKRDCMVEVVEIIENQGETKFKAHIAIAPTKNISRIEWFVEKATEVGIGTISFFISKHSERREVKVERLEKVATAAMKQSLKTFHPQLGEITDLRKLIDSATESSKFIAHYISPDQLLLKDAALSQDSIVLIGPEGDFSAAEVEYALSKGFKAVSLGNTRLRTETAALVAIVTLNNILDR